MPRYYNLIATLRQHDCHATATWLPRYGNGEAEGLLGVWGDAEAVVGAFADEPKYALLGIGKDELCSFLKDVLLAVGEIIAEEFRAGHAEGDEAVAGLYVAQG